jgi:hypothetical protein
MDYDNIVAETTLMVIEQSKDEVASQDMFSSNINPDYEYIPEIDDLWSK